MLFPGILLIKFKLAIGTFGAIGCNLLDELISLSKFITLRGTLIFASYSPIAIINRYLCYNYKFHVFYLHYIPN